MNSLLMPLLSLLFSLEIRERHFVINLILQWKGLKDNNEPLPLLVPMKFPERPLTPNAQYVLKHVPILEKDDNETNAFENEAEKEAIKTTEVTGKILETGERKESKAWAFFLKICMEDCQQWLQRGGQYASTSSGESDWTELEWLKSPSLRKMECILGAGLEVHEQGEKILRISMITDLLSRVEIRIASPGTFVRYLAGLNPPQMEILTEGSITFRLTDVGLAEARSLRDQRQMNKITT